MSNEKEGNNDSFSSKDTSPTSPTINNISTSTKTKPIMIKKKSGNNDSPTLDPLFKGGSSNSFSSSPFKSFLDSFSPRRRSSNQDSPKSIKHLSGGKEELSPKTKVLTKEGVILEEENIDLKRKISAPTFYSFKNTTTIECGSPTREFLNFTKEERKNAVTLIDRKDLFK